MKDNISRTNYNGIDMFRGIAVIMVAAIHTAPLKSYNEDYDFYLIQGICRLAVPFYFIANGFFWKDQSDRGTYHMIKRISQLYVLWTIIYLPVFVDTWNRNEYSLAYNLKEFLFRFVFSSTMTHFWYFPAVISAVFLIWVLRKRLADKYVIILGFLCYVTGMLGEAWYFVISSSARAVKWMDTYFEVFRYTRNGLLFGFFFIMMGVMIRERRCRLRNIYAVSGFLLSLVLMYIEITLLRQTEYIDFSSYLSLVPAAFFLFMLLLNLKLEHKSFWKVVRKCSVLVFCVHIMIRYVLMVFCENHSIQLESGWKFAIVLLGAFCISSVLLLVERCMRVKIISYMY